MNDYGSSHPRLFRCDYTDTEEEENEERSKGTLQHYLAAEESGVGCIPLGYR